MRATRSSGIGPGSGRDGQEVAHPRRVVFDGGGVIVGVGHEVLRVRSLRVVERMREWLTQVSGREWDVMGPPAVPSPSPTS
jgi:hypothetical protein